MDKRILLLDSVSILRASGPATYSKGDLIWVDEAQADGLINSGVAIHAIKWTDLRIAAGSTTRGGSKVPTWAQFMDDGAGSQGVFLEHFSASAEEELYFTAQFGHDFALGTNIHPHVHWIPSVNGSAGQNVSWGLEYTWIKIGTTFPNTTIISGNAHFPDETIVANRHYLTELGIIDGSGIDSVSSMLACRIFRDATGALKTDDFAGTAGLLEIDFHYRVDSEGSETEYIKNT